MPNWKGKREYANREICVLLLSLFIKRHYQQNWNGSPNFSGLLDPLFFHSP
jgi:hypothetical protein